MTDWIETFLEETNGIRSPGSFRLWTAIATVAGVLERRVWTHTDNGLLYPNLYTILAGSPASGKSLCVNTARNLWANIPELRIGPDNPTKASFMDALEESQRTIVNGTGATIVSPLAIACREFGVLIPKHDAAFLGDLTDIYDNPPIYSAPRRTSKSVIIQKPCINILAAATPDFLYDLLPESAWGQGFTSRLLFIYGAHIDKERDIFNKRKELHFGSLLAKLVEIFNELQGEFEWSPDAQREMNLWYNSGRKPVPNYGRLVHYLGRRDTHCLKLTMISSVSAEHGLLITKSDFERALHWLLEAEKTMPDVFRAMVQKSDKQLLDDLHWHAYTKYASIARDKRKPITEGEMFVFLEDRATSDKIPRLIESAVKSGRFRRGKYPDEYVPQPLTGVIE